MYMWLLAKQLIAGSKNFSRQSIRQHFARFARENGMVVI